MDDNRKEPLNYNDILDNENNKLLSHNDTKQDNIEIIEIPEIQNSLNKENNPSIIQTSFDQQLKNNEVIEKSLSRATLKSSGFQSTTANNNIIVEKEEQDIAVKKAKSKKIIFIPIIMILLVIVVSGVSILTIFNLKKDSKNAFLLSLNNLKSDFSTIIEATTSLITGIGNKYSIEGNTTFNIQNQIVMTDDMGSLSYLIMPFIEKIRSLNLNYIARVDVPSKQMLYQIIPSINNEELIDFKYYIENKKHYINLGDVFENYIEIEELEQDIISFFDYQKNIEDFNYLDKVITNSFIKNLKEEYFIKERANIKVEDKNKEVIKSSIVLDKKNSYELISNILKDLQKDTKTVDIISYYYPNFKDYKLGEDEYTYGDDELLFSTYMDKLTGKHYQYEVKIISEQEIILLTYNLKNEVVYSYNSKDFPEENKKYIYTITKEDHITNIKMTDSLNKLSVVMTISENQIEGTLKNNYVGYNNEINFEYKKVDNGNYEFNMDVVIEIGNGDQKLIDINIASNAIIKKITNVNENIINSVKIEDLTPAEQEEIMNKLFEKVTALTQ